MENDLAYQLNGETLYYSTKWEKIEDEHYPECPVSIGASKRRVSTLCLCAQIEVAEDSVLEEVC